MKSHFSLTVAPDSEARTLQRPDSAVQNVSKTVGSIPLTQPGEREVE
jgi:hypothetical protein